jgi:hypothetical protein
MINEKYTFPLTGHNGNQPQAIDIACCGFSERPGTEADTPRTPGNIENPQPWQPCQFTGFARCA